MKNKTLFYLVFLSGLLFYFLFGCKKETIKVPPTVSLIAVSAITTNSATSGGDVASDGGAIVTDRGICIGIKPYPTTSDNKINNGTGLGGFTSSITGLNPGVTYYVRAFATNSVKTSYSGQVIFATLALAPVLTTVDLTAVTSTSATSGGNITSDGGAAVMARGVCWNIDQNPTTANSKTTDGTGIGTFASNITGLLPGTVYYIKAYATNSIGTVYGNQLTLTTTAVAPVLTTTAPTSVTSTIATTGGNITSDGGSTVTVRGVCWATTQNPTIANSKTTDGTGSGTFISNLTGLIHGTTYYLKAYATNSIGTAYGNQVSFTTTAEIPTLTTNVATSVTATTALSGGNITSDGGSLVTARGVCWATTQNPTVANSNTTSGTGSGSYVSNISGLTAGTTYYVRSYAINSIGTAYGNQIVVLFQGLLSETFTDFDGNVYHAVVIGSQTWMVETLKTTKFRNGVPIPNIIDNTSWSSATSSGYSWYNNNAATYKVPYGAIYNWYAMADNRGLAPSGWHIPTDAEWTALINSVGGEAVAGGALKETGTTHWSNPNFGATNSYGFNAVAGGRRDGAGNFTYQGFLCYWWAAGEYSATEVRYCYLSNGSTYSASDKFLKMYGYSVRCVKD